MHRISKLTVVWTITITGWLASSLALYDLRHNDGSSLYAIALWTLGIVCDIADGWSARRMNVCTKLGAYADHYGDIILTALALLAAGWPLVIAIPLPWFISIVSNKSASGRSWLGLLVMLGLLQR